MVEQKSGSIARLRRIKAVALDMDGTVYLGGRLLPGAREFVDWYRGMGIPVVFLTNNSSKSRAEYHEKLTRLGLDVGFDQVMTSGEATIRFLHRDFPGQRVYLVATQSFTDEAIEAGVPLAQGYDDAEMAVLAFDTSLTFEKLTILCDLVRAGKPFIATHPDLNCPVDGGYIPDVGSMLALVKASTGRAPDRIVGKPDQLMITALCEKLGVTASNIVYIGDRLYTDVAMAVKSGMLSVLVLSGETALCDIAGSDFQPDLIYDGLNEMVAM